jgi:hypothetical protein
MARTKTRAHTRKTRSGVARVKSYVRKNKGKSIGMALGAGVGIGALVLAAKKRGINPKVAVPRGPKGSPSNPYVERALRPAIGERSSFQSRVKKTFTDAAGKLRKKGQVMPGVKRNDVNASYIQEPSPGFKQTIAIEAETVRPGVRYELDNRNKPKPLNLKKKKK